MLPELNNFYDLINKIDYDYERLKKTSHIYELLDCFLTLNAFPEWIQNSDNVSSDLKKLVENKLDIMKGKNFPFDEENLFSDIDTKLRLIRLLCNHAKHKTDSKLIPKIEREYDTGFPMEFPAKFGFVILVGKKRVDAEYIILEVTNYWKSII